MLFNTLIYYVFRLYHIDDVPSGAGGESIDFNKAYAVCISTEYTEENKTINKINNLFTNNT